MDDRQNPTTNNLPTDADRQKVLADAQYTTLIEFKALGGIITDEDGTMKKLTMSDLSGMVGVHRDTLYEWMKRPGFWDAVNVTRKRLSSKSRLAAIQDKWYLKALEMKDWRITEAWLRNHDEKYRESRQTIEHEIGNSWASLLEGKRKEVDHVIEGEVVDDKPAN